MSERREQQRRVVPPGEHTNADLLKAKTQKGTVYSEAIMLQEAFGIMNKTNVRKHGHADTRALYTPEKIKIMKQRGNAGFNNETLTKFW